MRTTMDIPDETYRAIKVMAAEQGSTVRKLILEGLEMAMRIRRAASTGLGTSPAERGTLEVDRESNDELVGFP
jgi:hypothetical protein